MRGRDASAGSGAASSSLDLEAAETNGRAGQASTAPASAGSKREGPAAQLLRRVWNAGRRLTRLCERGREVWRPLLATLFLGLLFASPIIWTDRHHRFQGSRRAGYRFLCVQLTPSAHLSAELLPTSCLP